MKIYDLERIYKSARLFRADENMRHVNVYQVHDVEIVNDLIYPNALLYSHKEKKLFNPINERTMSLGDNKQKTFEFHPVPEPPDRVRCPVFFFLFNTDNYYHFVYDTLPYLVSYFELKQRHPELKLLVTYPNKSADDMYLFVEEFLELAGVKSNDIMFAFQDVLYENMMLSDSYTHGHDSNLPPRWEVYGFLRELADKVEPVTSYGEKIYISRRSWKHNNKSNMGTDYTTRRKMENEDNLVDFLTSIGYNEVFTELLSTEEKLGVFKQATHVVGAIGGGMCNVLFCPRTTIVECLVSPHFLDINERFSYCFNHNTRFWTDTEHVESSFFKKHMRVKFGNQIGEIKNISNGQADIEYSDSNVAGWNCLVEYKKKRVPLDDLTRIDAGLNSAWKMDLTDFKKVVK